MAVARGPRGLGELRGAEYTTIVLSVLAVAFGALYALFVVIFLHSSPPDCGESHWTDGPIEVFGALGLLAALGGVGAGIWAVARAPRWIGAYAIVLDLGVIAGGYALLRAAFTHSGGFELCGIF